MYLLIYSCQITEYNYNHHHHHEPQGLEPSIRSVSRVTAARANTSSVFQLLYFLVVCSGMISKGIVSVAPLQKTGIFGGPEVNYHQTYSATDWLSILRLPYPTQNLQRKYRTDSQVKKIT